MKNSGVAPLHSNIIDAVVHQVGANRSVNVHGKSDFQLGADSVHARNQHRIHIFLFVDGKQRAEAADLAQHPASEGLVGEVLNPLLGAVPALDVNARIGVGDSGILGGALGPRISPFPMKCWEPLGDQQEASALHIVACSFAAETGSGTGITK